MHVYHTNPSIWILC